MCSCGVSHMLDVRLTCFSWNYVPPSLSTSLIIHTIQKYYEVNLSHFTFVTKSKILCGMFKDFTATD